MISLRPHRTTPGTTRLSLFSLTTVLTFIALLVSVTGVASAYYTAPGGGSSSATLGTLQPPTNLVVPATSSGTVNLSWTASVGALVPTGYFATRTATSTGSTAVAACGTSLTSTLTTVSCDDSGVLTGTYTYTVTAVYKSWTATSTKSSSVTVSNATSLAFQTEPSGAASGTAFTSQPKVVVRDAGGQTVTASSNTVTLAIMGSPVGVTLTCAQNPLPATSGIATFSGCRIDKAGTYTLTATSTGLTAATSASITITFGAATKLAFTTQPTASTGGVAFSTQPVLTVQDSAGNTVTTSTTPVTLNITTPAGATLTCTSANPLPATAGVATFAGCKIDKAGAYTLTASSGTLASATSTSLTVSVGTVAKLSFTTQPPSTSGAGSAFATTVTVQDAGGNTITGSSAAVALTLTTPGPAVLTCASNSLAASAGIATFTGCQIDKTNTYTLTATSSGLTTATSSSIAITPGTATKLSFTTQPSATGTSGSAFSSQPSATVQDAFGNTVTTSAAPITLSITTPAGATLTCTPTTSLAAASGVATFAGCKIDKAGGYTLTAASSGLTAATSIGITISAGAAARLAFSAQPSASTGGIAFGTQPSVTVLDTFGNTVATSVAPVTLSLTTPAGAALTCTSANPLAATSGVATFAGCKIDKAGSYTLTANSGTLTSATSSSLTISVGSAAKLGFLQPTANVSAISQTVFATGSQPSVAVQDLGGNTITGSTATVTLSLTAPAGATLACTPNTLAAVSGVATFTGCQIDKTGTYTLTATSPSLTNGTSSTVTITPGTATKLSFTTQPSASTGGIAFPTQPVVSIQDASGNTVTTSTAPVTLSITTPAGATLTCNSANPLAATSGIAAFAACRIDKTGSYTLTAISGTLSSATSTNVTISVGAAATLTFTTPTPAPYAANTAFSTSVTVQDAGGNAVATSVTLDIASGGNSSAVLTCSSLTAPTVSGVAAFNGCKIDKKGITPYKLRATAGGVFSTFDIQVN